MVIKMPMHLSVVYPGNVLFTDSMQGETRAQIFEIDQPEKLQTKTQITEEPACFHSRHYASVLKGNFQLV